LRLRARCRRNWGAERYQVGQEISQGGIGTIFSAYDRILGREIAIKLLQNRFRDDPKAKRRFLNEAKIIAKLQHPGITPIYEVLKGSSDHWFISMPLVRGTTLGKLLAVRQTPAEDLPRYLKVFEKVCQAMAYAHEKGVIHRDLKPNNIMIGPFGEVFVMDWGIAKVLGESGAAECLQLEPRAADKDSLAPKETDPGTRFGSVLGSPGFLAPEQARGEIVRVDKRSDVFGLGAILCVILTGKGPYQGKDSSETLRQAEKADTGEAFLGIDASGFDQELITLVKNCLRAEPEDRPKNAGEVAQKITHYLESKTEEFSRGWLNLTTDGIWDRNLETNEEYFSPRLKKLLGYGDAELPNRTETWQKLIHPDDFKLALHAFKQHTEEGKPFKIPVRYRHKDGSTVWVLCRGVALKNEAGKFARMVGTLTDITAFKQAEEELAERVQLAELGADVGVVLNRTGTLPEILQCCAEVFVRRLGVAFAGIWTLSKTGDILALQAGAGLYTYCDGPHSRVPVGTLQIGLIAQERKPHLTNLVIGDPCVNDQEWARREGMVAFAGYPLIYRHRVVGVLAMFSRQPFSPVTFESLSTLADSIAYAIAHRSGSGT
jgi:PAS domain S-box-containing protein